jgi:hypothetical protein
MTEYKGQGFAGGTLSAAIDFLAHGIDLRSPFWGQRMSEVVD